MKRQLFVFINIIIFSLVLLTGCSQVEVLEDILPSKEILTLRGHKDTVTSVAFSPNSQQLASGSMDNTIKLWDVRSGKQLNSLRGHKKWVNCVTFSPDGERLG